MKQLNLDLSEFDTPVSPPAPKKEADADYHIISIKKTSNGKEILLCTTDPAPPEAIEESKKLKLPLFTVEEIFPMRAAAAKDPGFIDRIIDVKTVFPAARVKRFREASA